MNQKYVVRNAIYGGALLLLIFVVYKCRNETNSGTAVSTTKEYTLYGKTMGTTYTVKYFADEGQNYQMKIEALLKAFNQSLSTYIPDSEISKFNKGTEIEIRDEFFYPVLKRTAEIVKVSEGAFDPTLAPLIRAWGFGEIEAPEKVPTSQIDSLLGYVGFDKYISFDKKKLSKSKDGVQLNFNAIAQGYGVDVIAMFLENQKIKNYMVEIGGEVRVKGKGSMKKVGRGWRIGIDQPTEEEEASEERKLQAIVTLKNKSLVTSGNYRKYYIRDGKKYPHTIHPKTGYPVTHNLLSATVLASDAMTADAIGTACMVLGKDKALEMVEKMDDIDLFLIYDEDGELKTTMTKGFEGIIEEVH